MTAAEQYMLLKRIESDLERALRTTRQLPGYLPLFEKIAEAYRIASAWRYEAELPEEREP
jgi:hypothetical protein